MFRFKIVFNFALVNIESSRKLQYLPLSKSNSVDVYFIRIFMETVIYCTSILQMLYSWPVAYV